MIELIELKAACNGVLRNLYPDMKIYGPDTTGALERPSFYTEIVPYVTDYLTKNTVKQSCGFKISLMEETTDEIFELTRLAAIRKAFGLKLGVANRKLTISSVEGEYTGSKNDVFQITIKIDWYDTIAEADTHDLMKDVQYRHQVNGG